jgi:hypothetical protein
MLEVCWFARGEPLCNFEEVRPHLFVRVRRDGLGDVATRYRHHGRFTRVVPTVPVADQVLNSFGRPHARAYEEPQSRAPSTYYVVEYLVQLPRARQRTASLSYRLNSGLIVTP